MPSPADIDLAKRDRAVPGLVTLLDTDAVAELWNRETRGPSSEIELLYLRYKPGTNCLAAYRVGEGENEKWIYAKAYGPDASVKLQKVRADLAGQVTEPSRRILSESMGIVSFEFPDDAKLPAISRLEKPEKRQRLIARILGEEETREHENLVTLAYKPERRYVAQLVRSSPAESVVLKLYGTHRYQAARQAIRALRSTDRLRLQRRCGGSKRYQILAFQWLPGPSLRDELDAGTLLSLHEVGAAIAELHLQLPPSLPQISLEAVAAELQVLAQTLSFLHPPLTKIADEVAGQIPKRLASAGLDLAAIHGDLYDKQIVLMGDQIGMVDLDDAALGDPRRDLGLFVAHLERDHIMGRDFRHIEAIGGTLLEGYQSTSGKSVAQLEPFVAEGMLRLAHHPFRRHTPNWAEQTTAILERAREILARAVPQ